MALLYRLANINAYPLRTGSALPPIPDFFYVNGPLSSKVLGQTRFSTRRKEVYKLPRDVIKPFDLSNYRRADVSVETRDNSSGGCCVSALAIIDDKDTNRNMGKIGGVVASCGMVSTK